MGGADAFEAMARACQELLSQIESLRPPIRLAPLARLLGVQLRYDDDRPIGSEEAAIKFVDGELVLWVSKAKFESRRTRRRARFSIAHEIGHLLLFKMLGPEFLDHSEANNEAYALTERLCDFAGSQILMPRRQLSEALRERSFTSNGIRSLEELFDVSSPALLRAVADLVPDGGVLELRRFRRHSGEALTWRVWSTSTASTATDLTSWLPTGCTLKHIHGLQAPESLSLDVAVFQSNLLLVRGKARMARDGIAALWPSGTKFQQHELLVKDQLRLRASNLTQDTDGGRLMLLIGHCGHVKGDQFGLVRPA
jgi:hypothetical protein